MSHFVELAGTEAVDTTTGVTGEANKWRFERRRNNPRAANRRLTANP